MSMHDRVSNKLDLFHILLALRVHSQRTENTYNNNYSI